MPYLLLLLFAGSGAAEAAREVLPFLLPAGQTEAEWTEALRRSRMSVATPEEAEVKLQASGKGWSLVVAMPTNEIVTVPVRAPDSAEARIDIAYFARALHDRERSALPGAIELEEWLELPENQSAQAPVAVSGWTSQPVELEPVAQRAPEATVAPAATTRKKKRER